jgi:hypothetical protein
MSKNLVRICFAGLIAVAAVGFGSVGCDNGSTAPDARVFDNGGGGTPDAKAAAAPDAKVTPDAGAPDAT